MHRSSDKKFFLTDHSSPTRLKFSVLCCSTSVKITTQTVYINKCGKRSFNFICLTRQVCSEPVTSIQSIRTFELFSQFLFINLALKKVSRVLGLMLSLTLNTFSLRVFFFYLISPEVHNHTRI